MKGSLAGVLHAAVESGDWSSLRERLAERAVLRTSNESGRSRIDGADAIVAHLARAGPGAVGVWEVEEWDTGLALTFEWAGTTTDRRLGTGC